MPDPSPETYAHFKDNIWSASDYGARRRLTQRDIDLMSDLERRLIIARAALKTILFIRPESEPQIDLDEARSIANDALNQTRTDHA